MSYAKDLFNNAARQAQLRELSPDELEHLKNVLLKCYLDVQSVCEKHGLSIMLGGGSCLGAVRHQGFIPWDDDVDVNMPRADFERFTGIFDAELGEKYSLVAPNHGDRDTYRFPLIKIKGTSVTEPNGNVFEIKMDLFLIENIPQSSVAQKLKGAFCHALMLIASSVQQYESPEESLFRQTKEGRRFLRRRLLIGRLFSFKTAQDWLNAVDKACKFHRETGIVSIPTGRNHYFGEMQPQKTFLPMSKGMFEGHEVNLPGDPHAYLSKLYGADYMTPPPPEKREKHYIQEIDFGAY